MGQAVMGSGVALYKVKGGVGLGKVRLSGMERRKGIQTEKTAGGLGLGLKLTVEQN